MKKQTIFKIILSLLAVAVFYFMADYIYNGGSDTENIQKNAEAKSKQDMASIIKEVSKFIILPEGEPIILDITNPEELVKQQSFFIGTVAGDKLLVYATSSKAVIWSPSRGKIVNVGPISGDVNPGANVAPTTTNISN